MAENIFKDLLPEEERDFENQPKVNNEFNDLLPQENITLKNEFNDLGQSKDHQNILKYQLCYLFLIFHRILR